MRGRGSARRARSLAVGSIAVVVLGGVLAPASVSARERLPLPPPPVPAGAGRPVLRPSPVAAEAAPEAPPPGASPWHAVNPPPFAAGAMVQLTDGTVMVQDQGASNNGSSDWWRLTPDSTGSYANGTWSQLASLPSTYAPLYFASAVLPDGRVIIEGGEYNHGNLTWTNKGAIYDPVADTWTLVQHPKGSEWVRIGDGPGVVLANGKFMVGASGYSTTTAQALLNAATLKWKATGSGKADGNGEEGWSLLPDGNVLTVDVGNAPNTEIYSPSTGSWASAGNTPDSLVNDGELGPQVLRPDGTVFAVGANGPNAVYDTATGTWSAGPSFPVIGGQQYDSADGAAAVLPNGNVLVDASPGVYNTPTHFFEFDGTNLTQVADPPNAAAQSSYVGFMMVLPNGQVLFNDRIGDLEVYSGRGSAPAAWRPKITAVPTSLTAGGTFTVAGRQLGGLTQGAAYGDDYQCATNYPLVRITNTATGDVAYARTAGMTSMSVARNARSSASFTLPASIETGPSTLVVVANGVASAPVSVTVS